jgi:ribosome-associated toxin RatA of RatAB toxin-antitoxin module
MFDLVNDIEKYPEFMRGCVEAESSADKITRSLEDSVSVRPELSRYSRPKIY